MRGNKLHHLKEIGQRFTSPSYHVSELFPAKSQEEMFSQVFEQFLIAMESIQA